jgi:GNAT superfamily N-acetyltransferase
VTPFAPYRTRAAASDDVAALVPLLEAYMAETYGDRWHGDPETLARDLGGRCTIEVAVAEDGRLVGLLAWATGYDLHHCAAGAEVIDLYVAPPWRGRGVALSLACAAAARAQRLGGRWLKGTAVETGSGRRLYGRIAVCGATRECTVGGRAFRRLAELAGRPPREMAAGLPEPGWNHES